jgi:hypothetical protein
MPPFRKTLIKRKEISTIKPVINENQVINKPKSEKLKLQVPTLLERIDRLKKENEMLDRVRKKYNPDYVPYTPTTELVIKNREKKIQKTRLEFYSDKLLSQKLRANTTYVQIKDTKNNRRIINALAKNYSASIRDALEISELLSKLNPMQVEGILYYIEHQKLALIRLKKKINLIVSNNISKN